MDKKLVEGMLKGQKILAIAKKHFSVKTLKTQNSDSLDFYDVAVWSIKTALEEAYKAGQESVLKKEELSDKVIDDDRKDSGYITAIIEGKWVRAKVYDEPSTYGVNNCRVSKIAISKTASRDKNKPFNEQMAYHYDRGLDFDKLKNKPLLIKILNVLNNLPKAL